MVIYAEYLFLENFIIGMMIMILTGKICGVKPKKILLFLGSVLCGIYSFIIFAEFMPAILAVLSKLVFSAVVVGVVFLPRSGRRFGKMILAFYIVSFAMGGTVVGIMYFFGAKGVSNNSFVYVAEPTYVKLAAGCFAAYAALSILASILKDIVFCRNTSRMVELSVAGRSVSAEGLLDTGNFLTDPISGKPVFLMSHRIAEKLLPEEIFQLLSGEIKWEQIYEKLLNTELAGRVRLIPFHSAFEAGGMLIGFRADHVTVMEKQGERKMDGTILAVSRECFISGNGGAKYDLLLHRDVYEGGVASHG